MPTISPALGGFIKGLLGVVVLVVVSYLANAANLNGLLNPSLAVLVAAIFSAVESQLKANSGGTTALFGAVHVK
jgi:hypothetical protein